MRRTRVQKLDRLLPLRRTATAPHLPDTHPLVRRRRQFDACLEQLNELERQLISTATARTALVREIVEQAEHLWPSTATMLGRQPPGPEEFPLPTIEAEARYLQGRQLRSACLVLLRQHGPLALRDLHRLLHLHGFAITSVDPTKCLANALAYEVAKGRARRVQRGVYEVDPRWQPRRGRHGATPLAAGPWGLPEGLATLVLLTAEAGRTQEMTHHRPEAC